MSGDRRQMWRCYGPVCVEDDVVTGVVLEDEPELAWQVRCPRGHWTWEDGRHCGRCGLCLHQRDEGLCCNGYGVEP